jgi:hypothetical protein
VGQSSAHERCWPPDWLLDWLLDWRIQRWLYIQVVRAAEQDGTGEVDEAVEAAEDQWLERVDYCILFDISCKGSTTSSG